jgi:formiminotetrahydrofolate cyclodeaminase
VTSTGPPHERVVLLELPLGGVLGRLSEEDPTTAGGAAAGVSVAMAAALVEMVGRASRGGWTEAAGAVAQAEALRARATPLADLNAAAYAEATSVLASGEGDAGERDETIRDALSWTVAVLLQIAETASDVADLASLAAERCAPALRADAGAAAALAETSARVAADLIAANLGVTADDERLDRARSLAATAGNAARRARLTAV